MLVAETQQIIATNNFDGTLPTSYVHELYGNLVYKPHTAGGKLILPPYYDGEVLTDPKELRIARQITGVRLSLGGQSAWSVSITDGDYSMTWLSGTTEASYFASTGPELLPAEWLEISTTAATGALVAIVSFSFRRIAE